MLEGAATLICREDHMPPAYWIDAVDLTIDLDPLKTRVLTAKKHPALGLVHEPRCLFHPV